MTGPTAPSGPLRPAGGERDLAMSRGFTYTGLKEGVRSVLRRTGDGFVLCFFAIMFHLAVPLLRFRKKARGRNGAPC